MKKYYLRQIILSVALISAGQLHAQLNLDSLNTLLHAQSIEKDTTHEQSNDFIAEYEITAEGDTIIRYNYKSYDYGEIYDNPPTLLYNEEDERKKNVLTNEGFMIATAQRTNSVDFGKYIGQIPFSEGMTPSGGKTYNIPISTAKVNSSAPQISITYNSQAGNGVAGYGWNLSGASSIAVSSKSIYYDNITAPVDLTKPSECVFSLDGTRLVSNTGSLSEYHYETAQGFILVKKHLNDSDVAYFTVAYPNGSVATFGNKENTITRHIYPIMEITDSKGYKINFDYIESGNNYYLTKVSYGGKSLSTHLAEIEFNYTNRTDYTTAYLASVEVSANKLLKSIISRSKVGDIFKELRIYTLTHTLTDNIQQLTQVDLTSESSSINPLSFYYDYYYGNQTGSLTSEYSQSISNYFSSTADIRPVYQRGKFVKNNFGDGLITFPGKFSPYTKVGEKVKKVLGVVVGRYDIYGSGYPAVQDILIAPGLSFYSPTQTIKTEEGFQTIQAVDVNGDGVDEIVKVNFGDLSGDNTMLKITVYTHNGSIFTSQSFTVAVRGVVNNQGETKSPMSRSYFFGDFKGNGKVQLLTISHNKSFTGTDMTSYSALIDLESRTKISETTLFSLGVSEAYYVYPLDMDGDGKMELCYATSSGMDVFGLSGNYFYKLYTTATINRNQFYQSPVFGDLNADGKIDILVPPPSSYYVKQYSRIPVWAPSRCNQCGTIHPLDNEYSQYCRICNANVSQFVNIQYSSCFECHSTLQSCRNGYGIPYTADDACCPVHGRSIYKEFEFDYIDNGNTWTAYLSTGKEFKSRKMNIITREVGDKFYLMDIDNDGNADLLRGRNNRVNLYLNKNGNIQMTVTSSVTIPTGTEILSANVINYYGMSHFIAVENEKVNCYKFTKDNSKANLLTKLTDSYGNRYKNDYSGMAELGSNYFPTSSYRYYPYFSLIAPLNLLRSSNINTDNETSVKRYDYFYYGAVMHRTGLGFVGFEKVRTTEYVENITLEEERNPEMFGVTTKADSPYKTIINSYSQDNFTNKKNNPRLIETSETDKLTGVVINTKYQYDTYNNPTKATQNIGSGTGITQVTDQTYFNSVSSSLYLVGQPLIKLIKSTRNGSSWIDKEVIAYNTARLPISQITYTGTTGANKTGETKWSYDTNGNITSETFAPYNVINFLGNTYTYDSSGRYIETVTNAMGQTTKFSNYDKYGNARTVKDYKDRITTHNFDEWGSLISTKYPDGTTEATSFAWGGQGLYTASQTATGQPKSVVHYDALGRELRTGNQRFDGQWQYVDNVYDSRGRLQKTSLPFKGSSPTYWNIYTYDSYNRPTKLTEASGKSSTWSYSGLSVTETKNGIATTKTTDASGALISVTDPGGTISYALRADGQPSSITAPGSVVTSFGYDAYGRQTTINDPSAGTQTFKEIFDEDGARTNTVKDANNKTVTTTYNEYGQIEKVERPEFTTSYKYKEDDKSVLEYEASNNQTRIDYERYDEYDRIEIVKETVSDGKWLKKTFSFSPGTSNLSSVEYESENGTIGKETFVYANGHNTEIKLNDTTTIWKLTEENALGQPTKATTGSINRTYSYTAYGMPTGRTAGSLQNYTYNFDVQKGNLLSRTDNGRSKTETFGYDNLNRLSTIGTQQIGYAVNGNITTMPGVGTLEYKESSKPYQVTMLTPTGTAVPLREQNVTYTSYQRPDTISENGITAFLYYNSAGDRVKMDVKQGTTALLTRYYISGQYELDTQTNTERLYLGGDAYSAPAIYVKEGTTSGKVYYICRDYLGSITHIANSDGSLKQELSYDAWGRLRNPATQVAYTSGTEPALFIGRGYTGHEHLPWFGLVNMNARLYDPLLGRFLSPDPYVQAPNFTQNFNRYSYCLNNPLVYVDQDGEFFLTTVLLGAFINTFIQGVSGNINNLGDFAKAFGIGALSGAAGFGAGQLVAGAVGTIGFVGGALTGASGGFAGGFVGGASSAWTNGASFAGGMKQGLIGGGLGATLGGLIGGISGGITAYRNGGDFWSGKGSIFESASTLGINTEDVKVGKGMKYTSEYAKTVAEETYGKLDYVNRIATNEIPNPTGSDYSMTNGCIISKDGRMIDGLTEYLGRGRSTVYLSKSAFVNTSYLKMTIGHEYIHATHNFMSSKGVLKASAKHNGILWTEISARHWETHTWGVQNGYGIYERQLGVFSWWRKNYFGWLINAKY